MTAPATAPPPTAVPIAANPVLTPAAPRPTSPAQQTTAIVAAAPVAPPTYEPVRPNLRASRSSRSRDSSSLKTCLLIAYAVPSPLAAAATTTAAPARTSPISNIPAPASQQLELQHLLCTGEKYEELKVRPYDSPRRVCRHKQQKDELPSTFREREGNGRLVPIYRFQEGWMQALEIKFRCQSILHLRVRT